MTTLIYSLEETAKNLGMSETVLVRLSQYFRIPQAAYEEGNYLSFKGDLGFTGHDIAFFAQVRDRILAGDSLEDIRQRVRYDSLEPRPDIPVPHTASAMAQNNEGDPLQRMAEQSFRRYKEANQTASGGVFKKMMHRVEEPPKPIVPPQKLSPRGLSDALGALFPKKQASATDPLALKNEGILPPRQPGLPRRDPLPEMRLSSETEDVSNGLDPALRQAALRLREKALQQPGNRRVFRR